MYDPLLLTAGIVAGLLVQNTLKYLLHFGQVTRYLGYNSLKDFFPSMDLRPNPGCTNSLCCRRQKEWQVGWCRGTSRPCALLTGPAIGMRTDSGVGST